MTQRQAEQEMVKGFATIFIGQYLSKIHGYQAFQGEAVDLLAIYMVKFIKILASHVKRLLELQGRTIPNALHLLTVVDLKKMVDFEDILRHINERKYVRHEEFDVLKKCGDLMFKNDVAIVNNYKRQTKHSNIQYVPAVYTYDLQKNPLPYRHPVDQFIQKPLAVAYKDTKKVVSVKQQNIQELQAYHRTEMKKASSILQTCKKQAKKHYKLDETEKKGKNLQRAALIRKSASETNLQPKLEMTKCKSTKDLIHVLPAEEEDHKVVDNEKKTKLFALSKPKQTKKQEKDQNSSENFTLKKAIVALELPTGTKEQKNVQTVKEGQNEEQVQKLVRGLSISPSQKLTYGYGLDSHGNPLFSTPKKNKFELISFL